MEERIDRVLSEVDISGKSKAERAGLVLSLLQKVQREFGYLPAEAIPRVAEVAGVPESHIYGVATFYAHFKFNAPGKHPITVCCGTACHVRGSARLLADLEDRLKIRPGQTTPDEKFSLETTACFGSCALAPVVVIGGKVQGRMNRGRMLKSIDALDKAEDAQTAELAGEVAR
ncbi:MAG: NADH-quinone oxidoreductase subunit NuoE family protein [Armatimonadota bacterium]